MQVLGIIGGSGLYQLPGLANAREVKVRTPFGAPSDAFLTGELEGTSVAFLPRHGRGHRLMPTEINVRANIWGMKSLGVTRIISLSAVGSMREEIVPGQMVLVDQFVDGTKTRLPTFFGDGVVGHVSFADPICGDLAGHLARAGERAGAVVHRGGVYLCIEGPQFSTRAESRLYRQWGVHVIGMTNLPEAKLAREAELCYATVALPTDYDCWRESEEAVSVGAVVATLQANVAKAQALVREAARAMGSAPRGCACDRALAHAVMTDPQAIPAQARRRLGLLLGKYFPPAPVLPKKPQKPRGKARPRAVSVRRGAR